MRSSGETETPDEWQKKIPASSVGSIPSSVAVCVEADGLTVAKTVQTSVHCRMIP